MNKKIGFGIGFLIIVFIILQNWSAILLKIFSYGTSSPTGLPIKPINSNLNPPYKDGTYTGTVADAFYGNVQVKVTISGGKISNVSFLQHPHDATRSLAINTVAMPNLSSEAIQAQNPNVNIVSGATDTSQAFMQSLQSALSQAK